MEECFPPVSPQNKTTKVFYILYAEKGSAHFLTQSVPQEQSITSSKPRSWVHLPRSHRNLSPEWAVSYVQTCIPFRSRVSHYAHTSYNVCVSKPCHYICYSYFTKEIRLNFQLFHFKTICLPKSNQQVWLLRSSCLLSNQHRPT